MGSQGEMLEHQAAARGLALPTHTYATLSKEQGRGQRSVMAVGPAPAELLDQVRLFYQEFVFLLRFLQNRVQWRLDQHPPGCWTMRASWLIY